MGTNIIEHPSKIRLTVDAALERMRGLHGQGRYQESLDICLQITRAYPDMANTWNDAAVNCAKLGRWQDTVRYAQNALACGAKGFGIYDMLAHGHGEIKQWNQARRNGLQALLLRDRLFGGEPAIPWPKLPPLPPLPDAQTRKRNVIAFSLFGGNPKYCETAILNARAQPHVYPHWVCRFYVDDSVPECVIKRLRAGGAQVVPVLGPAAQWPGPMWRLLALNDRLAHRVLFRDADSVIARREAAAVAQWLTSGKRFHMMRDWYSHTELILAGLWGAVAGSLPPLGKLMERFMSAPLESVSFADQNFLRQYVWPYARASLMQHDAVFGFRDSVPFPTDRALDESNVGYVESSLIYNARTHLPDGSAATWALYRIGRQIDGQDCEELVCAYPGTVKEGIVAAPIPARYARWIRRGTARIRVVGSGAG